MLLVCSKYGTVAYLILMLSLDQSIY